jgi:hypothetical protein
MQAHVFAERDVLVRTGRGSGTLFWAPATETLPHLMGAWMHRVSNHFKGEAAGGDQFCISAQPLAV